MDILVPDCSFRCSHCIKIISEDSPIYMRHDNTYCSPICRQRGLSKLFRHLKDVQQRREVLRQSLPSSDSSAVSSSHHHSESSLSRYSAESRGAGRAVEPEGWSMIRVGARMLDGLLSRVAPQPELYGGSFGDFGRSTSDHGFPDHIERRSSGSSECWAERDPWSGVTNRFWDERSPAGSSGDSACFSTGYGRSSEQGCR